MTDHTELKLAAEAASQGRWNQDGFDVQNDDINDYRVARCNRLADAKFIAAANPAAVLALIAENDRLSQTVESLIQMERATGNRAIEYAGKCDDLKAEVAGLRNGYEAYERVNAELKAECEALRKDADRFRRMRAMTLAQIEDTQDEFDAEFDRQLDAAMGNGEQS